MARTLIKGGWILSMDPGIGDIRGGDVLVDDDSIVAVGRNIAADDVQTIDASNRLVLPGFINMHQHTWETGLRGTVADWTVAEYMRKFHATAVPLFRPDDVYIANLFGALNQINCGTTTLWDWHHCNATIDHTDAAIDALAETGIRAIYGHGTTKTNPKPGEKPFSEVPHPRARVERLRKGRLASDDARITLAMCILGPALSVWDVTEHDVRLARELGVQWSCHTGAQGVPQLAPGGVRRLADLGLLGPDADFVHAQNFTDEELKIIIDHGGSITIAAECEYNFGHGDPATHRVLALGGCPCFGVDVEANVSGDMMTVLRFGLQIARGIQAEQAPRPTLTLKTKTREALEWGTIGNARALGMDRRIGSLTPGKQADLILIRTDDINTFPVRDPVQTVIFQAYPSNIDTVMVAGEIMKRDGRLVYPEAEMRRKMAQLDASGARILEQAGIRF